MESLPDTTTTTGITDDTIMIEEEDSVLTVHGTTALFDRKAFDAVITKYIAVLSMDSKPADALLRSCAATIDQSVTSVIDVIRVLSFLEASKVLRGEDICKFFDFIISSAHYWNDKAVTNGGIKSTNDSSSPPPPPSPPIAAEKIQIIHYDTVDNERFQTMLSYVKSVGYLEVVDRIIEVLLSKAECEERQQLAVMYSKRSIEASIEQRNFGDILLMVKRIWRNLTPESNYLCNTLSQTHVRSLMIISSLYLMGLFQLVSLVHACVDHTMSITAPPSIDVALNPQHHAENIILAEKSDEDKNHAASLMIILCLEASDAIDILSTIHFITTMSPPASPTPPPEHIDDTDVIDTDADTIA